MLKSGECSRTLAVCAVIVSLNGAYTFAGPVGRSMLLLDVVGIMEPCDYVCWTEPVEKCHVEKACEDVPEQKCKMVAQKVCDQKKDVMKCSSKVVPKCTTTVSTRCRDEEKEVCRPKPRRRFCKEVPRRKCEIEYREDCGVRPVKECFEQEVPCYGLFCPYPPHVTAVCIWVQRHTCERVPFDDCRTVYERECTSDDDDDDDDDDDEECETVDERVCEDEEEEECEDEEVKKCEKVKVDDCRIVQKKTCKTTHKKECRDMPRECIIEHITKCGDECDLVFSWGIGHWRYSVALLYCVCSVSSVVLSWGFLV